MKTCATLLSLLLTLAGCPAWAEGELVTGPDRRHEIDLRIEALDARRAEISVTGPKTATLLGVGAVVVGGIMFGAGIATCRNGPEDADAWCEGPESGIVLAGTGGGLLVAGGVTAIVGGIVWQIRADRRNDIDAERESLIEERDGLADALSRLELRSPYRNGAQFVTLGVRF